MGMYQTIHEPIEVIGIYAHHTFLPKKFKWKNRVFPISETTLQSNIKDGEVRKRLYSVMAEHNLYRLEFNRETEDWLLEEIWME